MNAKSETPAEGSARDQQWEPGKSLEELHHDLLKRYKFHKRRALKQKGFYRGLGFILSLAIPILSAFIAYLSSIEQWDVKLTLGVFSLILTILAIVNSTLKPTERYVHLAQKLIDLYDWKFELEAEARRIGSDDADELYELYRSKNASMSELGLQLARNRLPKREV